MRTLALFAAFALVACAGRATDGTTDEAPIVNGTLSTSADDAVVRVIVGDNHDEVCTGTLVAPNVVLTARHCVATRDTTQPRVTCHVVDAAGATDDTTPDYPYVGNVNARSISITVGTLFDDSTPTSAMGGELVTDDAGTMCSHDVALVILDRSIPGVTPKKVREAVPAVGELVTAVGWGFSNLTSSTGLPVLPNHRLKREGIPVLGVANSIVPYRRQSGTVIPSGAGAGELVIGEGVCNGDSGGPLLDAHGDIVGTTSRRVSNISARCVDSPAIFTIAGATEYRDTIARALARGRALEAEAGGQAVEADAAGERRSQH